MLTEEKLYAMTRTYEVQTLTRTPRHDMDTPTPIVSKTQDTGTATYIIKLEFYLLIYY
jgi:hypothetical protein